MRKKLVIVLSVMAIAAVIGLTSSKLGVVSADPYYSAEDIRNQVSEMYPGEITEIELENEGKALVYEVEVKVDGYEYELKIDGNTGEVLKLEEKTRTEKAKEQDSEKLIAKEVEVEVDDKNEKNEEAETTKKDTASDVNTTTKKEQNEKTTTNSNNHHHHNNNNNNNCDQCDDKPKQQHHKMQTTKKAVIGYDEAKRIALKQFDGTIKDIELDDDDNRLVYEVEIKRGNQEADIKIDAYTGKVLVLEIESDDDDDDDDRKSKSSSTKSVIGTTKAKQIALQQFDGKVESVELDDDDNRHVYEVEIERGEKEAEIIIDAYTGKVLNVEIDD